MSTPGQGTSIELLLPRADVAAAAPLTPPAGEQRPAAANATILVAEDEPGVLQLAVETLQRRGYRVLPAPNGEDALKLAAGFDGTIHLLVTDVVMPGMKGPELADRMRALRPGIRVLMMSGYATDVVTPGDLKEAPLLQKPFSPGALTKAVAAILDVPLSSAPASQG
jgi:DNA-binding NtrC family response regulator